MIRVSQTGSDATHEWMNEIQARRLPDGRVELWAEESRLKTFSANKTAKWHRESVIMTLSAENAAKMAAVFCPPT